MILKSEVEVLVDRSLEATFDAFTLPDSYLKIPSVQGVQLLEPGAGGAPNTKGAVRQINLLIGKLVEEIEEAEALRFMSYRFREWPVPFRHAGGTMRFFPQRDQTRVVWDSAFELPDFLKLPLLPDLFTGTFGFSLQSLARELKRVAEKT